MNNLKTALEDIKSQYHRVIIIKEGTQIAAEAKKYCTDHKIQIVNLSAKLSELMAQLPKEEREMEAWDKLKDWISSIPGEMVAFEQIDYIFSPEVGMIDPVKEFNYYSRSRKIVILFIQAKKKDNLLIYSEEGNPDYKEMDISNNEGFVLGW